MDILVRFSSFLFSRLSATDQCEKIDEIRQKLADDIPEAAHGLLEESEEDSSRLETFKALFKKLAVAEQNLFLSSEMNKYKLEYKFWMLYFWFQQLEADDQRELLEKLDPITPGNVQIPGTGDDDAIDYLAPLACSVPTQVEKQLRRSDAKFRIDRFKQLPAGTPKIRLSASDLFSIILLSRRSFILQQDFASAAQLLSRLSTFGFSLLSPCDRKIVAKFCKLYGRDRDDAQGSEEDLTMESFTELYNAASFHIGDQVFLLKTISETFFDERMTREFIFYFRQQATKDQEEIIEELLNRSVSFELDASDVIIEKSSEESEEDFRDRQFINLCVGYPFLWERYIGQLDGAGKWDLGDLHETSRYTKYLNGFANIWAKARCSNDSRNLIQLIVGAIKHDGIEKHIPQGDDIEKLPDESVEDFRVRRFTESFNRLQFKSQKSIVEFIQNAVFQDVGIPLPKVVGGGYSKEDRSSCVLELIKFKAPNLRGGVVPPTSQEGSEVVNNLALDFERSMC